MRIINTILMTIVIMSLAPKSALAESLDENQHKKHYKKNHKRYQNVLVIGADPNKDNIWIMKGKIVDTYAKTTKKGFQQSGVPNFIISSPSGKAIFGIGGFVNFRTSYDWNNVIGSKDFVTSDIPMTSTSQNKQRLLMDASTTRLFFKAIVQSRLLGPIESYIETDFRGNGNSLRLREAYIAFKGVTLGQTATTFTDLKAAPNTIDFEGPNAYTYSRNLLIRYTYNAIPHWDFAIAAEMPDVSATTPSTSTHLIPQRVPDIPMYAQYSWDNGNSHLRASGVLRTMNYYDNINMNTETTLGWGTMLSSRIKLHRSIDAFGQIVYGEGIENYIQDITGDGYDLVPNPNYTGELQTLPAMGWMAGVTVNITNKWQMNGAYSQVRMWNKNGYFAQAPDTYKLSKYIVANLFYNITPALNVGAEYLYGTRENANNSMANANCAQMMIQLNF